MFKVIIIGGKCAPNYEFFENKCKFYLKNQAKNGIMIYSTGDKFVEIFSKRFGIDVKYFNVDWKKFKGDALKERNEKMFKDADAIIAFSNGTKNIESFITSAKYYNTPIRTIRIK